MSDLVIYVISSKDSMQRLSLIKKRFPERFSDFKIVHAISGEKISSYDYFNAMIKRYSISRRIISPNELGCARSHIVAMEDFIASKKRRCLILEDDILGDDDDLNAVVAELYNINNKAMLICGTQINRVNNKYLPVEVGKAKKLNRFERYFVSGAFSYGLTQEAAKQILYNQKVYSRADEWTVIAKNIDMYFVDILKHPEGYTESTIESQREKIHKDVLDKIKYDGLFLTVKRNIYKIVIFFLKHIQMIKNNLKNA